MNQHLFLEALSRWSSYKVSPTGTSAPRTGSGQPRRSAAQPGTQGTRRRLLAGITVCN